MYIHRDKDKENDETALPDVEIFFYEGCHQMYGRGYYWHSCFPGCLPDSDPIGPFETEEEAIEDARES